MQSASTRRGVCHRCDNHGFTVKFHHSHLQVCKYKDCRCSLCFRRPKNYQDKRTRREDPAKLPNRDFDYCAYCRVHGLRIYINGQHSKFCKYRNCQCQRCSDISRKEKEKHCSYCGFHGLRVFAVGKHSDFCKFRACPCALCKQQREKVSASGGNDSREAEFSQCDGEKGNQGKECEPKRTRKRRKSATCSLALEIESEDKEAEPPPKFARICSQEDTSTVSVNLPNCRFCSNHGFKFPMKEHHVSVCLFLKCDCEKCSVERKLSKKEKNESVNHVSVTQPASTNGDAENIAVVPVKKPCAIIAPAVRKVLSVSSATQRNKLEAHSKSNASLSDVKSSNPQALEASDELAVAPNSIEAQYLPFSDCASGPSLRTVESSRENAAESPAVVSCEATTCTENTQKSSDLSENTLDTAESSGLCSPPATDALSISPDDGSVVKTPLILLDYCGVCSPQAPDASSVPPDEAPVVKSPLILLDYCGVCSPQATDAQSIPLDEANDVKCSVQISSTDVNSGEDATQSSEGNHRKSIDVLRRPIDALTSTKTPPVSMCISEGTFSDEEIATESPLASKVDTAVNKPSVAVNCTDDATFGIPSTLCSTKKNMQVDRRTSLSSSSSSDLSEESNSSEDVATKTPVSSLMDTAENMPSIPVNCFEAAAGETPANPPNPLENMTDERDVDREIAPLPSSDPADNPPALADVNSLQEVGTALTSSSSEAYSTTQTNLSVDSSDNLTSLITNKEVSSNFEESTPACRPEDSVATNCPSDVLLGALLHAANPSEDKSPISVNLESDSTSQAAQPTRILSDDKSDSETPALTSSDTSENSSCVLDSAVSTILDDIDDVRSNSMIDVVENDNNDPQPDLIEMNDGRVFQHNFSGKKPTSDTSKFSESEDVPEKELTAKGPEIERADKSSVISMSISNGLSESKLNEREELASTVISTAGTAGMCQNLVADLAKFAQDLQKAMPSKRVLASQPKYSSELPHEASNSSREIRPEFNADILFSTEQECHDPQSVLNDSSSRSLAKELIRSEDSSCGRARNDKNISGRESVLSDQVETAVSASPILSTGNLQKEVDKESFPNEEGGESVSDTSFQSLSDSSLVIDLDAISEPPTPERTEISNLQESAVTANNAPLQTTASRIESAPCEEGSNSCKDGQQEEICDSGEVQCKLCDVKLLTSHQMRLHSYLRHNCDSGSTVGKMYRCRICSLENANEAFVLDHESSMHMDLVPLRRLFDIASAMCRANFKKRCASNE